MSKKMRIADMGHKSKAWRKILMDDPKAYIFHPNKRSTNPVLVHGGGSEVCGYTTLYALIRYGVIEETIGETGYTTYRYAGE